MGSYYSVPVSDQVTIKPDSIISDIEIKEYLLKQNIYGLKRLQRFLNSEIDKRKQSANKLTCYDDIVNELKQLKLSKPNKFMSD